MKSTFGQNLTISLFGESHGSAIGCVLDGFPSGLEIDIDFLNAQMNKRRAQGTFSTARLEADQVQFVSGVKNGVTCGTPICLMIENTSVHSKDYTKMRNIARPSHADYTAQIKYGGFQDADGGGHFSGRLTAALTAAGALCLQLLKEKGISIGSHLYQMMDIKDDAFDALNPEEQIEICNQKVFSVLNPDAEKKMMECIEQARVHKDSVGALIETAVAGLPAGIGDPYFHSLESVLSHLLFSIGGVKGIEFGSGFNLAQMYGSKANDSFVVKENKVMTTTNHTGGINGGISNGMPVLFKTIIKPTPSIYQMQKTVDFKSMENVDLEIEGRHDPCIAHRARVVIDSLTAIALVDLMMSRSVELDWMGKSR
ncbi:MAG: chorismate synthase [Erysipelotrichaceae bacterium]|nr:chorismate synthase [Erysipelotrichaceae bacterium]